MLDPSLAAPEDGVRGCPEPAAGGMGLLPQQGLLAPRKGLPQHEFCACLGLGVTQATSTPLISLLPWLGWGDTLSGLPGPLCSPLQVSQRKAGPGGQRLLGAGRKSQRDARPGPGAPCPTAAPALPAVGCRGPQLAGSSQGTAAPIHAITTSQLMALGRGFR